MRYRRTVGGLAAILLLLGMTAGCAARSGGQPAGAVTPSAPNDKPVESGTTVLVRELTTIVDFSSNSAQRTSKVSFTVRNIVDEEIYVRDLRVPDSELITQTGAFPDVSTKIAPRGTSQFWVEFHVGECDDRQESDPALSYQYRKGDSEDWISSSFGMSVGGPEGWVHNLVAGLC